MMRTLTVLPLLLLAACSRGPAGLAPESMAVAGDTGQFGAPVAMTRDGRHVVMDLKEGSNVWFFNVSPEGWADLLHARPLPAGRSEVALPRAGINTTNPMGTGGRGRADIHRRATMTRTRLLRRDALLIVVWPRGVDPAPTFNTNHLLVDLQQPQFEVPEMMFEGRRTAWASYLLEK